MFRFIWRKIRRIFKWFRRLGIIQILTILLIVIAILVIATLASRGDGEIEESNLRLVDVRSVATLSSDTEPLTLIGRVESQSEADIRAESQGEITRVYSRLGDKVFAGQILAETENSSQKATLLQTQALLEAAEAGLLKLTSGSRSQEQDILFLSVEQAEGKLEQSNVSALNTLNNTFAVVDDILFNKVDELFSNPRAERPSLNFTVPDQSLSVKIEDGRASIGRMLDLWEEVVRKTTAENNLIERLNEASANLNTMRVFINDVARAVNTVEANIDVSATQVATRRANMLTARNSLNVTIGTVVAEINSLNASYTALEISKKNQEIGIVGGRSEDVIAAEAQVKQAEGSLAGARAAFEKTIVRTPITGTLNSFPIKRGSFVSMFQPLAVVSNNNALEITSFITEEDRGQISIGAQVLIEGKYEGVVTNVAPALDPLTKKIEITIAPIVNAGVLVNGESVRLGVERNISVSEIDRNAPITIPISALKIEPDKVTVFSINESGATEAHSVTLGQIIGEKVVIVEGLTAEMSIVTDARGLKDGQVVEVR